MELNELSSVSPLDGRYRKGVSSIAPYFSEFGLMRYRVLVEIEYFIALAEIPLPQLEGKLTDQHKSELRDIYLKFSQADAERIKEIERTTNHDVKAVEYLLKEHLEKLQLSELSEFIHFGLTSQDVNNTAIPASLKDATEKEYLPLLNELIGKLKGLADKWMRIPMLARTHGQPASPTKLGKEIYVFVERLEMQISQLNSIPWSAKFGGATGNFNAHHIAYPSINWADFSNRFLADKLELHRSRYTTQIEHYDNLSARFDAMRRINVILLDLCRDMWTYISMEYFRQRLKEGEVGSSAMPHKVNPIDFENAEGNFGIANSLFHHLSEKLPVSRLQRDLTDSTVLRNIGVPFGHSIIAFKALQRGLDKLLLNEKKLAEDLEKNWAVVAEAIQTILRREGYPKPYEALKALTRGNSEISHESISTFIDNLQVRDEVKKELKAISPQNYTGIF